MTAGFTFDRFAEVNLADPYPLYQRARDQAPVYYAADLDVWVISRYEDVRRVAMDPMRFSSAFRMRTPDRPAPGVLEILADGHPEVPALLNEDPPDHRRTRDLVAKALTPRRISALEPRVVAIVAELIDAIQPGKRADLVAEFAAPLPPRVSCELIGLPARDGPRLRAWIDQLAVLASPGAQPEEQRAAARASVAFDRYLAAAVTARRDAGRDDLITDLTTVRADGVAPLTDTQIISLLISLVLTGHQATTNLIGSALVLLLHRPQLWAAIGDDPELLAAVVEETARVDPPVQGMFRRAVFDVTIEGVRIPAGARVLALFASANRDPAVFADPDEFDPGRADRDQHLGYGRGIHFCVAPELARLEARTAIRSLRTRLPTLSLDPDIRIPYQPSLMHRGPAALPATWT